MNDRLLAILADRPDFTIAAQDRKLLDFFVEYLDHGSLFLFEFEPGADPAFSFTNDAQLYRFNMSEIREHVLGMKRGIPMAWEDIPFTYLKQN